MTPRRTKRPCWQYRQAIEHNAPQKIDASERLALLLEKLGKPDAAEQSSTSLWRRTARTYRVYLAQGRYRHALAARDPSQKSHLSDAKKDFETAKEKEQQSLKSTSNWLRFSATSG